MSGFNIDLSLPLNGNALSREVEKIIGRLDISPAGNLGMVFSEDVRIAATQVLLKNYESIADYVIDMNLYVSDAVNRRAQLVCFPAYAGLLPATLLPQFKAVLPQLRPQQRTGLPDIDDINDILSYFSDAVFEVYFNTMSLLSAGHGVYIMAGTTLYFENDELFHRAFLFNDAGDLVGFQDKLTQNNLERELEVMQASELKTFATPFGDVAILICEDADYFETARVAKNLGAKVLIAPGAFTGARTSVEAALGVNMRAQENTVYGVLSTLVGLSPMGFALNGAAFAFSPNAFLAKKNGVLAETSGRHEPDIICARLNLDRLDAKAAFAGDKNPDLMKKYIDRLY